MLATLLPADISMNNMIDAGVTTEYIGNRSTEDLQRMIIFMKCNATQCGLCIHAMRGLKKQSHPDSTTLSVGS